MSAMKCPSCGGKSGVVETRELAVGLRRRRRCLNEVCGLRFTTAEVVVPDYRKHPDAAVIVVDRVRADALRVAVRDLDDLLGGVR